MPKHWYIHVHLCMRQCTRLRTYGNFLEVEARLQAFYFADVGDVRRYVLALLVINASSESGAVVNGCRARFDQLQRLMPQWQIMARRFGGTLTDVGDVSRLSPPRLRPCDRHCPTFVFLV